MFPAPAVIIRQLGETIFEIVPPTAAIAEPIARALSPELADTLRRGLHASFWEAVGAAATLAVACDWSLKDETGQLDNEAIEQALDYARELRVRRK